MYYMTQVYSLLEDIFLVGHLWSERSPFISEVAGSILSENFLNVTRTQCSIHLRRVSQRSAEGRGVSLVSSYREVDRVG